MLQKVRENNVQAYNPYCHSSYGCSYNYKNVRKSLENDNLFDDITCFLGCFEELYTPAQ